VSFTVIRIAPGRGRGGEGGPYAGSRWFRRGGGALPDRRTWNIPFEASGRGPARCGFPAHSARHQSLLGIPAPAWTSPGTGGNLASCVVVFAERRTSSGIHPARAGRRGRSGYAGVGALVVRSEIPAHRREAGEGGGPDAGPPGSPAPGRRRRFRERPGLRPSLGTEAGATDRFRERARASAGPPPQTKKKSPRGRAFTHRQVPGGSTCCISGSELPAGAFVGGFFGGRASRSPCRRGGAVVVWELGARDQGAPWKTGGRRSASGVGNRMELAALIERESRRPNHNPTPCPAI